MLDTSICIKVNFDCSKCAIQSLCGQQYLYKLKEVSSSTLEMENADWAVVTKPSLT